MINNKWLIYAFIGWVVCAGSMGFGLTYFTETTALILHVIIGPLAFFALSWHYHRNNQAKPIETAVKFLVFLIGADFLVALVFMKSIDMFLSPLGTWIPFLLIFVATYVSGHDKLFKA